MSRAQPQRYLIALGSNQPHHRHGNPRKVLIAALSRLDRKGLHLEKASRLIESPPLGPSRRRYANGAALVRSNLEPHDMLKRLQHIEAQFGRRRSGQPWRARVLDLDIVLWSGGAFAGDDLIIPHPQFRTRAFVLTPARGIVGSWRDPVSGLTIRHLHFRLTHGLHRRRNRSLTHPHSLP